MSGLRQKVHDLDIAILHYLNPVKENHWVSFFQFISDTTSVIAYCVPIALLLAGMIGQRRIWRIKGGLSLLTVIVADYSALLIKVWINRPRPFVTFPDIIKYGFAGNASFPSGHTTQAVAMAASIALLFPRWPVIIPVICWAMLVGYGRIYLGVHYPSDVAGGAVLSTMVALLLAFGGKALGLTRPVAETQENDQKPSQEAHSPSRKNGVRHD